MLAFFPLAWDLTAKGGVPPLDDGHTLAPTGFHVRLEVITEDRDHALVLAQVIMAVCQEGRRVEDVMTGLELGRQDLPAQGIHAKHLLLGTAGLRLPLGSWLAAGGGRKGRVWRAMQMAGYRDLGGKAAAYPSWP